MKILTIILFVVVVTLDALIGSGVFNSGVSVYVRVAEWFVIGIQIGILISSIVEHIYLKRELKEKGHKVTWKWNI